MFDYSDDLDALVSQDPCDVKTLRALRARVGNDALPGFLIDYIATMAPNGWGSLTIHKASSIAGSVDADQTAISRDKGFMGKSQLEPKKFPSAVHHIKVFHNAAGKAKLFYKYKGSLQFVQNLKPAVSDGSG